MRAWPAVAVAVAVAALGSAPGGFTQAAPLEVVLDRAGRYALDYEARFSVLVAEEEYYQRAERSMQVGNPSQLRGPNPGGAIASGNERARRLRSEYLLVRNQDGGWMPFRDVFEVDGRRLRDREDRLARLLMTPTASAFEQARRFTAESTRYNLGRVTRTINVPTLGVLLPRAGLRERFVFTDRGDAEVDGRPARMIDYQERTRPTLVRTPTDVDLPMSGTLWVAPDSGVVLRTVMSVADANVQATVSVDFAEESSLSLWVPARMTEHYRATQSADEIRCTATYRNYRTFQVSTTEEIEKPAEKPAEKKPGGGLSGG